MSNWTDEPCFYVSVVDGGKVGLLAGPFQTHDEALAMVEPARIEAQKYDDRAWFYGYGTIKTVNGLREGILNAHLGIDV